MKSVQSLRVSRMKKYNSTFTLVLTLTALSLNTIIAARADDIANTLPSWKRIQLKVNGVTYNFHETPDGKALWTDIFLVDAVNVNLNSAITQLLTFGQGSSTASSDPYDFSATEIGDEIQDGKIINSDAVKKCENFGKSFNFYGTFVGKKMTLPSKQDYETHLISHFNSFCTNNLIHNDDESQGITLFGVEQFKTAQEVTEDNKMIPLFRDMIGKRFWTSSVHTQFTADAFFFDGNTGNANNYGTRAHPHFIRCIVR